MAKFEILIFDQKNIVFFQLYIFSVLVIRILGLEPDPYQLKILDPDPH
jgi:hypothetical protein